ncbi:hypothetical protein RUND412_006739 [Rhizina undulata]
MSLKIQHLNADATFQLRFYPPSPSPSPKPYIILLDPWLHSDAPVYHRRFSTQEHTVPCHISSLRDLESPPDIVLVSQGKSDHCHEGTLKELDWSKGSTKLVAVPDAAGIVAGWKWFQKERLTVLKKEGVTINLSRDGNEAGQEAAGVETAGAVLDIQYLPAKYPWELPSVCSGIGIKFTFPTSSTTPHGEKTLSILFAPHGSPFSAVSPWLSGLPLNAASPEAPHLSLLLHPFNDVHNPAYLGGTISHGFPGGLKVCQNCDVGTWMSAHDEDKKLGGFVAGKVSKNRRSGAEVVQGLRGAGIKAWEHDDEEEAIKEEGKGIRILVLEVGEELEIFP